MRMRPMWPGSHPQDISDWRILSQDLAYFLEENALSGCIGVGHSLGAIATLRLALDQPHTFQALVLLDPVLFPPAMIYFWKTMTLLGLISQIHPLAKKSLKRRTRFENREAMYANYRKKSIFSRMSDDALSAYVDALACPNDDGTLDLCYSSAWESRIYLTGILPDMELWNRLGDLKPPTLIVRGAETDTFWKQAGRLAQRRQPSIQVITVENTGHLVPLERPEEVARLTMDFLKKPSQPLASLILNDPKGY